MLHTRNRSNRAIKRQALAAALTGCLLLFAAGTQAQSAASTVRGRVTAAAAPAPGAEITVTNTATGLTRSVIADAEGDYTIGGLPPGTYKIDVRADGGAQSQTVTLAVAQVATVDVGVEGAAPADTVLEGIEVTAPTLVETKTSEIATYISPTQIDALPQVSRNFLAFADIVPGIQVDTDPNDGSTRLRGGAQNSNGINVYIDGIGQKNYVLKGGISGQDSSRGNPFPQSAIGEYKVITQNYKAEFDQLSSAAIVAVTRSGGNEFEGSVFYDRTSDSWRAHTPRELQAGRKTPSKEEQYGFTVAGPIVQDRLHYFFSYEAKDKLDPRDVTPGENVPVSALPSDIQAMLGSVASPFYLDLYFGKLTWSPDDRNLVEFSAKVRNESEITGLGGVNAPSRGASKDTEETRLDLRHQFSADAWINDAHLIYEDSFFQPRPITLAPGYVYQTASRRDIVALGGGRDFQDKGQEGWGLQDDFTYFAGDHTLKTGFKYKQVKINAFEQQPYNPQYFFSVADLAEGYSDPNRVEFGAVIPGLGDRNITSENEQYGIYFQDDWEVTDRLLLNLGLRWDYERTPGYLNYVTRPDVAAALRNWANLDNADYDIEDYISNGSNREAFKDAWQPRVGFSYDLSGDERHVLFGGAGRSYDRNLWDYLALEQSKGTFPAYTFNFDTPTNPCTAGQGNCLGAWNDSYLNPATLAALVAANPNLGGEINLMNNELKTPYSDQFSFGIRDTWGDWNTSVSLSHVESHDGIVFTLGNRWPNGAFRDLPTATWGHQPWGQPIPGFGTLIIADNGIETRLNALLLSADKPFTEASGWGATIAYTYSDAEENRSNAGATDEHYLFDYPNLDNADWQRATGVPRHRLVMTGIYQAPWDIRLSGKFTIESPVVKDAVNCYAAADFDHCFFDAFEVDGTIGYKQLDLSAGKDFHFGDRYWFNLRADVLNVFNHKNWTDFETWRGGPGEPNPAFGSRNGLGTTYPPRLVKLSASFNW
jgi:outer membrane receptor protein involved in Fe transport